MRLLILIYTMLHYDRDYARDREGGTVQSDGFWLRERSRGLPAPAQPSRRASIHSLWCIVFAQSACPVIHGLSQCSPRLEVRWPGFHAACPRPLLPWEQACGT